MNNINTDQDQTSGLVKEQWSTYSNIHISSLGRTRLPTSKNIQHYPNAINHNKKKYYILEMVATAFLGYDPNKHIIKRNNIDTNRSNKFDYYKNAVANIVLVDRNLPGEIWLPVPNHPDYMISNLGRALSIKTFSKLLKTDESTGYQRVMLCGGNGLMKRYYVHRLVYSTFNPGKDIDNLVINHIDGNGLNNKLDNLEAITQIQNIMHSVALGTNLLPGRGRKDRKINFEDINWRDKHIGFSLPIGRKTIDASGFRM